MHTIRMFMGIILGIASTQAMAQLIIDVMLKNSHFLLTPPDHHANILA